MATIAKQCFLFFLLALIFSVQIQARDSQLFNKVPSNVNKVEKETNQLLVSNNVETGKIDKQEPEPNFVPENENGGYGLYGHETGQLPPVTTTTTTTTTSSAAATNPSTTTADETYKTIPNKGQPKVSYPKYLPKNYNTEAYVTEPEGYRGEVDDSNKSTDFYNGENRGKFDNNKNTNYYNGENRPEFDNNKNANFYNGDNGYYNNNDDQKQDFGETKLMGKSYSTNPYSSNSDNYNYGNSNNYYNGEPQGMSDNRYKTNYNYYNHNVGDLSGVQKQGMSDTRFLENGKYYYDVGMEQQNFNNGPYGSTNNRNYYANPKNSYEFNNYQNQEEFQNFHDNDDMP